jgi:glycosyltransferase involved in cell wall biosynthesis
MQLCRRQRVRIWHGHDYKSNALGLLLRKFWPMHLVTTMHGWVQQTQRTPLYYKIDQWCLPHYASVICVSNDLYESARKCGVPAERCVLIENGIDAEQFACRRSLEDAKLALGLPVDRLVIGAVGRMAPEKGYDLLIQAVHKLITDGEKVDLFLIGDGEERQKLVGLAAELGIAGHVRFAGYCSDPRPFYEAMDVFALSSLREGLPNVVLEALAMEVPVVATRVAGVPRLIEDGVNGLLVEPGSADELARGLARLLGDSALRERFQCEGRRTVERRYSFAERINKIAAIYDRLLAKDRRTAKQASSNGKLVAV